MKEKIGRNNPCPCGSGKKYKHCCIGKEVKLKKQNSHPGKFRISRLSIMRFRIDLQENPQLLAKASVEFSKATGKKNFMKFVLEDWDCEKLKRMTTSEITEKFRTMGVKFEIENFKQQTKGYISAIKLADDYYLSQDFKGAHTPAEDFIWLAIIELWNRLLPEQYNIEMIDYLMQDGYRQIQKKDYKNGVDNWLKGWEIIKALVPPEIKSVQDADDFMPEPLTQFIYNWCQDLKMELYNLGIKEPSYFFKRADYCREFYNKFPSSDDLLIRNMQCDEAESYFHLGQISKGDELFKLIIKKFPKNVWGYICWADQYCLFPKAVQPDFNKAEQIYKLGLSSCNSETEIIYERLEMLKKEREKLLNPDKKE